MPSPQGLARVPLTFNFGLFRNACRPLPPFQPPRRVGCEGAPRVHQPCPPSSTRQGRCLYEKAQMPLSVRRHNARFLPWPEALERPPPLSAQFREMACIVQSNGVLSCLCFHGTGTRCYEFRLKLHLTLGYDAAQNKRVCTVVKTQRGIKCSSRVLISAISEGMARSL